ncbi:GNAT family N-acetyltransferase [Pseudoxanthomonas sp.]|uniref:GNAT family N-acetyltransferase n=1 Tax=Pseudoxanthomonas sp. TaxID=1871049 RepID=UPI003F7F1C26
MNPPGFRVEAVDYAHRRDDLLRVRETVFVREQHVPLEEERDALDPLCRHVLARDDAGQPIGTGRLTPEHRIGRMAVLREWRGRGVGDALLAALIAQARLQRWPELTLNAQVSAESFYARHGFVPYGPRFHEAGIEHQAMRRRLDGATAIEDQAGARASLLALAQATRRRLCLYSRDLEPGLFDAPEVLDALRRLATRPGPVEIRVLLQDAGAPQRRLAPLLPLAQRLPSVFLFREVHDPVDRNYASAYAVNEADGYYFRPLGHRFDGEADLDAAGRARQLREEFAHVWERSRPCTEYRALGI